jgi:hypothetical protein
LQIRRAFEQTGPRIVDGKHLGYVKKLAMNNTKRVFHHRDKGEFTENDSAYLRNYLGSESSLGISIKVLELTPKGVKHFRNKIKHEIMTSLGIGGLRSSLPGFKREGGTRLRKQTLSNFHSPSTFSVPTSSQ